MRKLKLSVVLSLFFSLILPSLLQAQVSAPCTQNGNHVTCSAPGTTGNFSIMTNGAVRKVFTFDGYELHPSANATALTATGTIQGDALQITLPNNVYSTVASGTGAILPVGKVGMVVTVKNQGAFPLKVYPEVGGTIDGLSANTAVTVMPNTRITFSAVALLTWTSTINNPQLAEIATGLTAAGTIQGDALALTAKVNILSTAAASTGVKLPVCVPGLTFFVRNGGANTVNIFPEVGGAINAGSANAAVTLATLKSVAFICTAALTLVSLPGA